MSSDYENEMRIDPDALDVEWLGHSSLTEKYGRLLADARFEVDVAKEDLDVVKAEVDGDIRENPLKYTGEDKKPTEAAISNLTTMHKRVRDAERRLAEAKRNAGYLQAAVNACDARKKALENLVHLLNQNYFAGPTEPRNLSGEATMREQARKKQRSRVADKTRRPKRTKK